MSYDLLQNPVWAQNEVKFVHLWVWMGDWRSGWGVWRALDGGLDGGLDGLHGHDGVLQGSGWGSG